MSVKTLPAATAFTSAAPPSQLPIRGMRAARLRADSSGSAPSPVPTTTHSVNVSDWVPIRSGIALGP